MILRGVREVTGQNTMNLRFAIFLLTAVLGLLALPAAEPVVEPVGTTNAPAWNGRDRVVKTDEDWRKQLSSEQYRVLRRKGTERAYSGKLWDNHAKGVYRCAGCDLPLFDSSTKFESGTGWPSFWQPIVAPNIGTEEDNTLFSKRTEVHCARCGGHLGHVFNDGPKPTGLRYCMNSVSLTFVPVSPEKSPAQR